MRRDVFQAISDPVRREIIEIVAKDKLTINDISQHFDISRPAVSKHLKILNECGIIEFEKAGRERICKIKPRALIPAFMWIDQYKVLWEEKIDNFERYLNQLKSKKIENGKK